ncbi:MAG TPA: ABC transporter ATP-binding protein [Geminicoccus sp.]|uniref:ABC transporter ATP-binding protein n=1 Tax=Geminicoccus sp. TaxID=2024832 RepID=UPI002E35C20A|nr:ABC transporter ATP-binding protein [Geminicoccus sp.]HEX2529200.1 ABC transporter ATP-binding protein [Geminicoccus sp.]
MIPLLQVSDLSVGLRGGALLVDSLAFRLERGQRLGIVGGSGSGKSVTVHAVAGLLPEELTATGSVRLDGQEILDLPETERARLRGRRIATIFQEPMTALDPVRRIADQVRAPMDIHRLGTAKERRDKVADLLAAVGLPRTTFPADLFPHELSGGQRQRVLLAAALAADPDVLLADEPTTALDLVTQRQILDLLDNLAERRGLSLVMVSHDLGVIARLCEHVLVMEGGRMVENGPVAKILTAPAHPVTARLVGRRLAAAPIEQRPRHAPLLVARGLTRHYRLPDRGRRVAVDDVDLEIMAGESVGLVGASGSGKSTLARLLTGLEPPDAGSVLLDGHDPGRWDKVRHSVQMVFQDPFDSLDPRWKIARIVGEPLDRDRLPDSEHLARVVQALREVELPEDALRRHPHAFSGGQRQRIAIARALVARPRLVVLDEPLSALDVVIQDQVLALLSRLRAAHDLTYLLISHDLGVVQRLCSRVIVLAKGQIVEEGPVDQILHSPRSSAARALVDAVLAPTVAPQQGPDY